MGLTVCRAVANDPELTLVAAYDLVRAGTKLSRLGGPQEGDLEIADSLEAFSDANVDVAVDFTQAEAARTNLAWIAENAIHAVVGTTGLDDADMAAIGDQFTNSNCLVASNFALSAVLMMRFAEMAAPFFDSGEIIELHHENKIDAPSGTAMSTVERMAAASSDWIDDPTEHEVLPGARGGDGPAGIRVHSVRMRGMIAHQEVILGALGQSLTIRQDSYDRTSFMPGVVLAIKGIGARPGLTVGLDALLDL